MSLFLKILLWGFIGGLGGLVSVSIIDYLLKKRSQKVIKEVPKEKRIDVLRKFSTYDADPIKAKRTTQMVLNNKPSPILSKYNYSDYCNKEFENEDDIVFSLLDFVCDNFKHAPCAVLPNNHSLENIIRACEKNELKTNCRGLSLILAELLRMNGIKARHVTCMPYEEPFVDCHVVVDCIMPSGARVTLDPTFRLYLMDENGSYVSIPEFRKGIIEGKDFIPNTTASYNGGKFNFDDYKEYMSKNLVRFETNYILNDSLSDNMFYSVCLAPSGYSTKGHINRGRYITDPESFWEL